MLLTPIFIYNLLSVVLDTLRTLFVGPLQLQSCFANRSREIPAPTYHPLGVRGTLMRLDKLSSTDCDIVLPKVTFHLQHNLKQAVFNSLYTHTDEPQKGNFQ